MPRPGGFGPQEPSGAGGLGMKGAALNDSGLTARVQSCSVQRQGDVIQGVLEGEDHLGVGQPLTKGILDAVAAGTKVARRQGIGSPAPIS